MWSAPSKSPDTVLSLWSSATLSSVQLLSRVWLFVTSQTVARHASLSFTNCRSLLKLMSIESVMPSNHLVLCHPLLFPPAIFLSIRVFTNKSALRMRWPKYWSFSFSITPSSEHPGLISFRMDWLDLLAVQGTLKSLLQHHSSKASSSWQHFTHVVRNCITLILQSLFNNVFILNFLLKITGIIFLIGS